MIQKGLRKNRVQFRVGEDCDEVTLILHPQYLEIAVSRSVELDGTDSLCSRIRDEIDSTLSNVTSNMSYACTMDHSFGFKCPLHHPDERSCASLDHICVKSSEFETKLMCLLDPDEPVPVDMEDCHRVWFGGGNRRSGAGMESGTLVVESVSRITSQTQSRAREFLAPIHHKKDGKTHCFKLENHVCSEWKRFAEMLDRNDNYVKCVEVEHKGIGSTKECWKRVMRDWLDRAEPRGGYEPTWDGLFELLRDLEHANTAERLKNALESRIKVF